MEQNANMSGYVRLQAGAYTLLAKCGEIGPSYQPGHAHADTFSFELWRGKDKIIGDTGCSTYVPGEIRSYERSTAAHNTIVIDGKNSSEVWAAHRVGRRCQVEKVGVRGELGTVSGTYRDQDGNEITRTLELTEAGLRGTDEVRLEKRTEERGNTIEERFHIPPAAESVEVTCNGERREEACPFAMGWNKREMGTCVIYSCGHAGCETLPVKFEWSIK